MKHQNLCKFPAADLSGALSVSCYVREADFATMRRETALAQHRMLLILHGEGSFRIGGIHHRFQTGDLLFALAGEHFSLADGKDVTYTYIDFEGFRADELLHRFSISPANRQFKGQDGLIPLWDESLLRASEKTIDLAAESILLYTFSRLFASGSERGGIVDQIIRITEEHFNDPELSISQVAQTLSYNSKYLSHLFKEKMQVNYSEYLSTIRLRYATTLFDHGLDSVKNVALLSGFSDPLYFSNVFKKQVGVSPTEYIRAREKNGT